MAYATLTGMVARFGERALTQLTDRSGSGVIDTDVLARAADDAAAEVDLYLGGRYQVPLAPVPVMVERISCDIAYYRLHGDLLDEHPAVRAYREAVRILGELARGDIPLSATPAGDEAGGGVELAGGPNAGGWRLR